MEKLYIVIPAYNESENIEKTIRDWYPILESGNENSRMLIINDGSKDNTAEIVKKLEKKMPRLRLVDKENGGHGSAVLKGYEIAIEEEADYIFQTDSDGQTNPAEFRKFWEMRHADAVIGIREKRGDGIARKLVENVVCIVVRLIFEVRLKDCNAPFRLMQRKTLQKYIENIPKDFNLPNIVLTAFYAKYSYPIFLPISFQNRKCGKNSVNLKKILKIGIKAVGDFKRISEGEKNGKVYSLS